MSDIFREVDEEIRREELNTLWDKYGIYILGLCAAIILGVGGFKGWQAYSRSQAETAGSEYATAVDLATSGKSDASLKAFSNLVGSAPKGYAVLARFQLAANQAKAGNTDEALKAYKALAADTGLDAVMRGLAQVRASMMLLDMGKPADIEARVTPLNIPANPWRHSAREILALSAYQSGDLRKADQFYNEIIADPAAPTGIRQRAQLMISLLTPDLAATKKTSVKPAK